MSLTEMHSMRECFWERLYLLVISWDGCWRRLSRHHRHHNKKPSGNHSQDTHQKCPLSVYKWFQTGNEYLVQKFPTKTRSCTKFIEWILTITPKPGCRYLTNAISLCFWKPKSENSIYVVTIEPPAEVRRSPSRREEGIELWCGTFRRSTDGGLLSKEPM